MGMGVHGVRGVRPQGYDMRFDAVRFLRALYAPAANSAAIAVADTGPSLQLGHEDMDTATATYTVEEGRLLTHAPDSLREAVDAIKATFTTTGGADLIDLRPDLLPPRQEAARLIRAARGERAREGVPALRDAWRERVAICTNDGGLVIEEAEAVALDEIESKANAFIEVKRR